MQNSENKENVICFPHLDNYYAPIEYLLKNIFSNCRILVAPKTTKTTLQLGEKYSPDFVCCPFKYNLGNFIQGLNEGANILIQAGGGCRFSFYGELQEKILRDLGYDFTFINLFDSSGIKLKQLMKIIHKFNPKMTYPKLFLHLITTINIVKAMDKADFYIRENSPYQINKNELENIKTDFIFNISKAKNHFLVQKLIKNYKNSLLNVKLDKSKKVLRVGIIGELYSLMESFANHFLERELNNDSIVVTRYTNATFLLFQKDKLLKNTLKQSKDYLKYHIGADGTFSVYNAINLAKQNYDGLIHIKPFGCTPEVNAIPMLNNISNDYNIPIIYFTFDSQTSNEGVKTRLEAFIDMIKSKSEDTKWNVI